MVTTSGSAAPHRTMTLAEWAALPEDTPGELVDGYLVEEEMPDWIHEETVAWLIHALFPWVKARRGRLGGSDARIATGERRGRKPDVVVFLKAKPPARGLVETVPDLVVEVVSASLADQRRDRVQKLAEYAERGIASYWIVDPELRSLDVLVLAPSGRYEHALATTHGDAIAIPGCPGLVIDLDALWRQLDELDAGG